MTDTDAGRALLDALLHEQSDTMEPGERIDAIEREAKQQERERIRREIGPDMYASLAPYIRAILAAEAADREAAGARAPDSVPSAAADPLEPIPTDWGVGPLTHPAAVGHDPTICTGTDAVPCGCLCFNCNERGIHQAAEAADREAAGAGESGTLRTPDARSSAAADPLDAAWHLFREHLAAEAERLGYWHSEDYDGTGNPRRIPCIPVTIAEQIAEKHWPVFAAAYADVIRKRGEA